MDLKFDNVTIAIMLYKARRKIALRKAIYNCRCQIDSSLSYEKCSLKYCPYCGKRMDGGVEYEND